MYVCIGVRVKMADKIYVNYALRKIHVYVYCTVDVLYNFIIKYVESTYDISCWNRCI